MSHHGGKDDGRNSAEQPVPGTAQDADDGQHNRESEVIVTHGMMGNVCHIGMWLSDHHVACLK